MRESAILIESLTKRFEDVTALNSLSFEVWKGELFGLLGPNGAGKTTTINVLCGLVEPTSGKAFVDGHDVQKEAERIKELIGVCPQDTAVFPFLTGRENVELFGDLHSIPKDKLRTKTEEFLGKMGLTHDVDRQAGKYSGGMRRRINLVMGLVHDPEIAFLDEPTSGLDPQSRRAVWNFIRELKAQGKTVILTTHYMEEAEELCDRVGIIDYGRLIAIGSPEDLKKEHGARDLEDVFIHLTGRRIREGV